MNCIAAVQFLSALHIDKYPVFGLVTDGKKGRLIMALKYAESDTGVRVFSP